MASLEKSKFMEEEMDSSSISGGFAYISDAAFLSSQLGSNLQLPPMLHQPYSTMPLHPPGLSMYNVMSHPSMNCFQLGVPVMNGISAVSTTPVTTIYNQPNLDVSKTNSTLSISTSKTSNETTVQKVITAAPQMAGPDELAARAKEAAAAAEASKSKATNDDDDVTRALLAAAAGVTYTRTQGKDGKEKVRASITKPPLTGALIKSSQSDMKIELDPAKTAELVMMPPPILPPAYRSIQTTNLEPKKRKKCLRVAAGVIWDDPKLAEWDPNDFRIFCGDLGYEVSDDVLSRAFNHYSSFQKARVVIDKRSGKSRGYGFVSFSDPDDFTRAMREMNGKYVGNRPIKLKKSDWRNRQLDSIRKREKEKKKLGLKK